MSPQKAIFETQNTVQCRYRWKCEFMLKCFSKIHHHLPHKLSFAIGCYQYQWCYSRPQTTRADIYLIFLMRAHYHTPGSCVSWHHDYPISITNRDHGAHLDWKFKPNITDLTKNNLRIWLPVKICAMCGWQSDKRCS